MAGYQRENAEKYALEGDVVDKLKGVIYFTDGQGIYPQKMPLYQTAFVFMDDGAEEQEVPPWAMKLVLDEEDLRGVRNR